MRTEHIEKASGGRRLKINTLLRHHHLHILLFFFHTLLNKLDLFLEIFFFFLLARINKEAK